MNKKSEWDSEEAYHHQNKRRVIVVRMVVFVLVVLGLAGLSALMIITTFLKIPMKEEQIISSAVVIGVFGFICFTLLAMIEGRMDAALKQIQQCRQLHEAEENHRAMQAQMEAYQLEGERLGRELVGIQGMREDIRASLAGIHARLLPKTPTNSE